ncbi:Adenylate cyclase 1 [Symbiodinium microadriaticum]|uniref:Adenylate cyclase 1 n=1 Tax=Symbiodinium microadriaticum TaxID=2951 RepID=A0A1Q9F3A4_SYMMI|nr:Adenylate cyclase 1 [Symbiodinium microadriaticum]
MNSNLGQDSPAQRSSSPVEAQKMWCIGSYFRSKLFQFADGITRMSWTAPISDCGSGYSCFSGVISADVMLGTVSTDCTEELAKLSKMLHSGYNYPLGEGNSSMFVVNHVSDRFPEQIGTLLGTAHNPSSKPVFRNATEISQGDPHEEPKSQIAGSSFSTWRFTFSKSAALRNQYVKCSWREEQGLWSPGGADCLQLGTMSLELDTGSRWLLVVVLPDGALNANALSSEHSASSEIELMTSNTHVSVNEARISASLIFFGIGFICVFISGTLAWAVSDPLQRMSNDMQRFSEIVRDPDCSLSPSEVTIMFSGIRDINRLKLSEEEVAEVIKRFHIHMTSIVEQNDGSIGEILDDGLLVYWNGMTLLRADIADHLESVGLSESSLQLSIGIHTGEVLCGNIGSHTKMKRLGLHKA